MMKTTLITLKLRRFPCAVTIAGCGLAFVSARAEVLYVDSRSGREGNPGTAEQPLQSLARAATLVNAKREGGAMTFRLRPGIYTLPASVVFENGRAFSREQRLALEASVLPDDPDWNPGLMPMLVSIEDPRSPGPGRRLTQSYGLKVKMSHVTIRGLKFLGSPLPNNWYCPLECLAPDLTDVRVTQCLFVGNPDTLDIYCAAITDGHEFVVDHCVFVGCHACAVFWDGGRGVVGKGNAMRYCIVDGAKISGVWTCDTDEDFDFHHNIVTRSRYFWLRKRGAAKTYRVSECLVADNAHYSGYGVEAGPTGETGSEVTFRESDVVKRGPVILETNRQSRSYLHVVPGTLGAELGAGLFIQKAATDDPRRKP
jgi:hypothetical protein